MAVDDLKDVRIAKAQNGGRHGDVDPAHLQQASQDVISAAVLPRLEDVQTVELSEQIRRERRVLVQLPQQKQRRVK